MARHIPASSLGSDFDDFLYASIGEDKNGTLLTVLSALARLDVGPWEEAAGLAQLPEPAATQRLASLIAALPSGLSTRLDPAALAARLIPLLPRHVGYIPSRASVLGSSTPPKSHALVYALYYLLSITIALSVQYFIASRQSPAQVERATAPASIADSRQMPPSPLP